MRDNSGPSPEFMACWSRRLLGFLYVLEGSTLGVAVVRPLIARGFHLEDPQGMAYLNNYGDEVDARWSEFKLRMNALTLSVEERQQILKTASDFFNKLETVFLALYPFEPGSKTFAVTSINPEAGRHAVPTDAREIQAALRASEICWRQFPYFEHRYGERGRRFARSDSAWKATLCHYEPERINQQVKWLGGILAVESLRPWMTDTARFPARWITAVETSLAQARSHATQSAGC